MQLSDTIIETLIKHGPPGLMLLLVIFAYNLLKAEQHRNEIRKKMVAAIYTFMGFNCLLFCAAEYFVLTSRPDNPEDVASIKQEQNLRNVHIFQDSDEVVWNYVDDNASEIQSLLISGASLENGISKVEPEIREVLDHGGVVKIVVMNPNDSASLWATAKRSPDESIANLQEEINSTITKLRKIKADYPLGKMQIKTLNYNIDERLHIVKLKDGSSRAFVKSYPFKGAWDGVRSGGLYFYVDDCTKSECEIFHYFQAKFDSYLSHATDAILVAQKSICPR